MTKKGKGWYAASVSSRSKTKRVVLVKQKKASAFMPRFSVDEACRIAGLP